MLKKWILVLMLMLGSTSQEAFSAIHKIPDTLVIEQRELEKKVLENPKSAEAHFELAMNYAYTGWIEIAWEQLKQVPKHDKHYAKTVLKKYSEKVKKDPQNWKYHFKLAFGYYFEDQKDLALASFQKAHELNPEQPWIIGFISLLHGEKKDYTTAIKLAKKAIEIEPNGAALHFLLAQGYQKNGNYFGFLGEAMHVVRLKSAEAKYRPTAPKAE
tara:strand:+ start:318 stop:959 length:642 start_codon:yes stop_codon:yes gene_type:complete